jgi:VanZ family protein
MIWRWLVWLVFVVLWTWALLLPNPDEVARALIFPATVAVEESHPVREELLEILLSFVFSKALHVAGYAALTALSGWLGATWRARWILVAFMSVHAMGTEFLQGYSPGRHPAWRDVGLDHLGIVMGLALTWRSWLTTSPRGQCPS